MSNTTPCWKCKGMRVMPDGHGQAVTCTYCAGTGTPVLGNETNRCPDGICSRSSKQERIEQLEEALRFYADGRHWNGALLGRVDDYDDERDALLAPVPGARARAALVRR